MKTYYTINIPEPCHENWNTMTPTVQGRFCDSCAKTVIDFTQMDNSQIQAYLLTQCGQNVCGRVKHNQTKPLQLKIPSKTFRSAMSIHKIFLLALLLCMGTSLLSCNNGSSEAQKIDQINIVASEEDIQEKFQKDFDTLTQQMDEERHLVMGAIEVPHTGDDEIIEMSDKPLPFEYVDHPPEFDDTPSNLSPKEKKDYFKTNIQEYFATNFIPETVSNLALQGRQRMYAKFTIMQNGTLTDIQTRAQYPELEMYLEEVIKNLPVFKPGTHQGIVTDVVYTVPIIFQPS